MKTIDQLIKDCPGLQFIPVYSNKIPVPKNWQNTKKEYAFLSDNYIGLVCGEISGGVEVIDIDLKYDISGDLFERYTAAVKEADPNILKKLVVQKTGSGGYHFIYRCSEIEGSQKLANRPTTKEEREKYPDQEVKVLIETKGEKGYIVVAPSPGYCLKQGSLETINVITPEERRILLDTAREFNEYIKEFKPTKAQTKNIPSHAGLTPYADFDQRGDVIGLLQKHNWKIVNQRGSKTFFLRPGDSKAKHSGNFDSERNQFSVFTTSSQFVPEKGYSPSAVHAFLECNGDFSESCKKLYSEGYGDRMEKNKQPVELNNVTSAPIPKDYSKDIFFLDDLLDVMVDQFTNGFPEGETTCFASIDPHFTWLRQDINVFAGWNQMGKSELVLQLMLARSVNFKNKWAVYCPENMPETYFYNCLIEAYVGKSISEEYSNHMSIDEYINAAKFIKEHFILIFPEINNTLEYVLEVFQYLIDNYKLDGVLIDPWNQLSHNIGTREDLYLSEKLSLVKRFAQKNDIYFNITTHVKTLPKEGDGTYRIPDQNDLAGGVMWGHKSDNVIIVHRPNYSKNKASTEVDFISHKIKKQKQVGIPGTAMLSFNRLTRRYHELNGNTPLQTLEVPVKKEKGYMDAFKFKVEAIYPDGRVEDVTKNNQDEDTVPF
jgi:hypothetical protein